MIWLLLALMPLDEPGLQRRYHRISLPDVGRSQRTHVETCGRVVYRRRMRDGDWHVTLEHKGAKLVVEFIPSIALTPPSRGRTVMVRGIRRYDDGHNWPEVHPVEDWNEVPRCPM